MRPLRPILLASAALGLAASAAHAQTQMPSALAPLPLAAADAPIGRAPPPVAAPPPAAAPAPPPPAPEPAVTVAAAPPASTVAAPAAIQATPLQAPDLFSADAGQTTGLPGDLWKGASADLARTVFPMVAARPLSPAARSFADRLASTPSQAPDGAGQDAGLAAMRINVVLSLGDPIGARLMLEHTPGVRQSAALSQVAAETDLVIGREDEACTLADNLAAGKDAPYFRRLRAYCLFMAGDKAGAQLAYDLTAEQAKDETYKRLMGAAVSGAAPGAPSLRNGIEYALSRRLGLDLTPAVPTAWAPVATMIARDPTAQQQTQAAAAALIAKRTADTSRASSLNPAVRDAALSVADNKLSPDLAERLAAAGTAGSSEAQAALALYAATGVPGSPATRAAFAGFDIGQGRANQARLLELEGLASGGAKGDAALVALWLSAEAGEAGFAPPDRARVIRALNRAGFGQDAREYALEGLLGLQPPPPAPAPPPKAVKKPPVKKRSKGN